MIIKSLIYGAKIVLINKLEKKQIDDKDVNVSADTMAETLRENSKMKSTMKVESPLNSELNK